MTSKEHIVETDVSTEMQNSFLEYAYSVIYSRALPDARDGLKPVQRRILFTMSEMGLRPDRGHVKSARVVGEVMGKLHPHGDGAIYDAMVRLAQFWTMRLPLIDGHGNFGSLDDGPAAYRYTEARLAASALALTASLDEDVVDFLPNYDGRELEPSVLPAGFPVLLVNGASGIAVGMATNIPPHNLPEVVAACEMLIRNPKATLKQLMKVVPGPDFPTGGIIVQSDGIAEAYESGKGSFKLRARVEIDRVSPRRQALIVTELPYNIGPEKVIEKIKDGVTSKKITGISDVIDLTDGEHGLKLVIELKSGFEPTAVLQQLYKSTPLEEQFSMNLVALVDGQPRTLSLREALQVFIEHRLDVVVRRSKFRLQKAQDRLHLVAGLLIAILNIDEVIQVIRSSEDTASARAKLMKVYELSEVQCDYILDMPLKRLTKYSTLEVEKEQKELEATIKSLKALLKDSDAQAQLFLEELQEVNKKFGAKRKTTFEDDLGPTQTNLEMSDEATRVVLTSSGLVSRLRPEVKVNSGKRAKHDVITSQVLTNSFGHVGVITTAGKLHSVEVIDIPLNLQEKATVSPKTAIATKDFVDLARGEKIIGLIPIQQEAIIALGTKYGVVKRVKIEAISKVGSQSIITLDDDDRVVGMAVSNSETEHLVFITQDSQLLHFKADLVRAQGKTAAGMAGITLYEGDEVIYFGVASKENLVITCAGDTSALPGGQTRSIKFTSLKDYPAKGRATMGVNCHTLKRGENQLVFATTAPLPLRAATSGASAVELEVELAKRDGTGTKFSETLIAVVGEG
jgi:DNA gyrase subunit A